VQTELGPDVVVSSRLLPVGDGATGAEAGGADSAAAEDEPVEAAAQAG
jgi:hypothetical protein